MQKDSAMFRMNRKGRWQFRREGLSRLAGVVARKTLDVGHIDAHLLDQHLFDLRTDDGEVVEHGHWIGASDVKASTLMSCACRADAATAHAQDVCMELLDPRLNGASGFAARGLLPRALRTGAGGALLELEALYLGRESLKLTVDVLHLGGKREDLVSQGDTGVHALGDGLERKSREVWMGRRGCGGRSWLAELILRCVG